MATQPQPAARLAFGPFEVNVQAGEIRKGGVPLHLAPQPFEILLFLLERPGEVVTREQLNERIWRDGTFVDFERGLNSAMTKLRRALGDDAERPRYIETHAGRGYRFIGTLQGPEPAQATPPDAAISKDEPTAKWGWKRWGILFAGVCLVSVAVGWRLLRESAPAPAPWKVSRITADTWLSNDSAMSRDGKLVAYSSDRGQEGERDIYVRQISGGEPIRLTKDGSGNTAPDFSPDGSRIVFQSNLDGGGIYEMPALGGEARLLARHGLNPKFSPDGSQVAYWVGDVVIAAAVPGGGEVWVVPESGGLSRRIGASFTNARFPIWAPDGQHLLLVGYTSDKASDSSSIDWWLVATDGGTAIRTGVYDALSRAGVGANEAPIIPALTFPNVPRPGCWVAGVNSLIFSTQSGDTRNLWETGISPRTGRVSGTFKRLTAGSGDEVDPSCSSANALTFTNVEAKTGIWSGPFDFGEGSPTDTLEAVTRGASGWAPSLSKDGHFVAFASAQSGLLNIWLRDLETGKESHIASSSAAQRYPQVNSSGDKVAFSAFETGTRSVYVWTADGTTEKLCEGCLRATAWSNDEKRLLVFEGGPYQIESLDVASHQRAVILKHATYSLLYGRFSPDNLWISFTARTGANRAMIVIAPLDGLKAVPESAWIKIAEEGPLDAADWSPDGKTLYYMSARDGHTCLWGQRIEPVSHRPVGEAFAVQHFHGHVSYQQGGWAVVGGRITVGLMDNRENVWMMSRASK